MRRKRIAALMAGVDREYQQAFTWGMVSAARETDVDLCVFNCQGHADGFVRNDRGERAIFELPELSAFDGAVVLLATIPTEACRTHISALIAQYPELPLVTIDVQLAQSVMLAFDDQSSVRELTAHLLDEHHVRSAAVVTGPVETDVAMARCNACLQVLNARGIHVDADAIIEGRWVREGGRRAVDQLFSRGKPLPDVIFCGNDEMAFGVIERLAEHNLSVPGDVKVTGFDGLLEAEGRGLTTIRRPVDEAGKMAVSILMDWMDNGRPDLRERYLPTRTIYGESCGCVLDSKRASDYVRILSEERRGVENSLLHASFFGGLAGVSGEEEAGELIADFAQAWGATEMHVCIDPTVLSSAVTGRAASYPEELLLLSSWSGGNASAPSRFCVKELLPRLEEERSRPLALVFSPLYYIDKNLGYAVFDVEHATGYALYSLLTLLSGALMSLSLQTTVRAYASVLENKSTHDALTGLYNRRGFEKIVPPLFEQAIAEQRCFAVVSCDMDGMKHINDCYGHLSGDKAICRMSTALRVLETHGLVCIHISGDEFLAVGMVENERAAKTLLAALHESVDRLNREDPWLCDIAASMGAYAAVPCPGDHLNDYLLFADRRMYADKNSRRKPSLI